MVAAGLDGPQASPNVLRHGFGVAAVSTRIPLNLVQKWLGHAQLTTTAICADTVGAEEKDIARKMWELRPGRMAPVVCAAPRVALYIEPGEARMDTTVEVTLPVDAEAAKVLNSPARREAAGRYLSGLLTSGRVRDVLAEVIAEAKREVRASGLTDEDIDAELEAWRGERKA